MASPASSGDPIAFLPPALAAAMRRLAWRTLGLGAVALGLALAAALVSFHPDDPAFNVARAGAPVRNLLGVPGAYSADVLLNAIGLGALLLAAVLGAWGARLIRLKTFGWMWLRLVLLPAGLMLVALGAAAIPAGGTWPLEVGYGGVAGDVLTARLGDALGRLIGAPPPRLAVGLAALPLGLAAIMVATAVSLAEWRALGERLCRLGARLRRARPAARPRTAAKAPKPTKARKPKHRVEPRMAATAPDSEDDTEIPTPPVHIVAPRATPPPPGRKAEAEKQSQFDFVADSYTFPALDLLEAPSPSATPQVDEAALAQNARLLETVLQDFGVKGNIVQVRPGPVVTLYELEPAAGVKSSRVIGLADDIARSMSAISARVAVVPGRNVIGIELPNMRRETVHLREILASGDFERAGPRLSMALGKDIGGQPVIADLAKMPHLLIAGTTGSGKSVGVNAMIVSLLYRLTPEQCRFIMIDPKMLELSIYDGIPHLLTPVVTDPHKAVVALKWAVREMEDRYRAMSQLGVRNIAGYNKRILEARAAGETLRRRVQTGFDPDTGKPVFEDQDLPMDPLPFIVIIVDEMADLMLVAGKDVEASIQRLAQMARAAGLHLVMATQRPSVDVITGTIKANFPTRISYSVTSKIDSRTILGEQGAEQLLGMGDMLYMGQGGRIQRVHGPFVADGEVEAIVTHLRDQGSPTYLDEVTEEPAEEAGGLPTDGGGSGDELYDRAVNIVLQEKKASTSFIQRKLSIGYNRAARIVERMEAEGLVSAANHVGKREVLVQNMDGSSVG